MNKLIWQICRFYLDGKFNWDMLDYIDQDYLRTIYHDFINPSFVPGLIDSRAENEIDDRIKKLVPFFFEEYES